MDGDLRSVRKIQIVDGVGITGWVEVDDDWKYVAVGNDRLLDINGGKIRTSLKERELLKVFSERNLSSCIVLVVVEDKLELALALADEVREEAKEFVRRATSNNLNVTMLTGDQESVALEVIH